MVLIVNSLLFGLSNEVLADKYLIAAKKYVKAKEYKKAVENFEKIFGLGIKVPNDLYYFYAKSLKNSGDIENAYYGFNDYIEKVGRGGTHYQEALEYIVDLEDKVIAIKKKRYKEEMKEKERQEEQRRVFEVKEKKRIFQERIAKSHNNWIFVEEDASTYYGMVSFSKKGDYVAWLKIGVFYDELEYRFYLQKDPEAYKNNYSVRIDDWYKTTVIDNLDHEHMLNSGLECRYTDACTSFLDSQYGSGIFVSIDKTEDLLALQNSKLVSLDYFLLRKYRDPLDKSKIGTDWTNSNKSGFVMPGGKKLKDIIDKIIERKKLSLNNNMVDNVVIDYIKNLMWEDEKSVETQKYTWAEAKKHCENLTLNGFDDWRLATEEEFQHKDIQVTEDEKKLGYDHLNNVKLLFVYGKNDRFWSSTLSDTNYEYKYYYLMEDNDYSGIDRLSLDKEKVRCVRDL